MEYNKENLLKKLLQDGKVGKILKQEIQEKFEYLIDKSII